MRSRIYKRVAAALRREDGMAIPTVIVMITLTTAFVTVVVTSTVATQRSDSRDGDSKTALAAADAGVGLAVARQNLVTTSTAKPCIFDSGTALSSVATPANGYCAVVGPKTIGAATYKYYVKPCYTACGAQPKIDVISIGTSDGVSRRIAVSATATISGGVPTAFGNAGVVGVDYVTMGNNAKVVNADVATNGYLTLTGSAQICGNITYGTTINGPPFPNGASQCAGYGVTQGTSTFPNVVVPSANANARLACNPVMDNASCLDRRSGNQYTVPSGGCNSPTAGNVTTPGWCEGTRTLTIDNGTTRTIGDTTNVASGTYTDYVLCQLTVSGGGQLIMPAGARVRIIFDSPENCGLPSGTTQLAVNNGAKVTSTGYNPTGGVYNLPGFYFVGSSGIGASFRTTNVSLQGGAVGDMIIYGPKTALSLANGVSWNGAMLGKTVDLQGGGTVKPSGAPSPDADLPVASSTSTTQFNKNSYVECVGALNTTTPLTGC